MEATGAMDDAPNLDDWLRARCADAAAAGDAALSAALDALTRRLVGVGDAERRLAEAATLTVSLLGLLGMAGVDEQELEHLEALAMVTFAAPAAEVPDTVDELVSMWATGDDEAP